MAKSRKGQAAGIRFGPALRAAFFCLVITGSAVGYVWQKGKIDQLGQQIRQRDGVLRQLQLNNQRLTDLCADLHEPIRLEQRAKEMNLGLQPLQPGQVVRIVERGGPLFGLKSEPRQWADRDNAAIPRNDPLK
jgi:hypothetical protein